VAGVIRANLALPAELAITPTDLRETGGRFMTVFQRAESLR